VSSVWQVTPLESRRAENSKTIVETLSSLVLKATPAIEPYKQANFKRSVLQKEFSSLVPDEFVLFQLIRTEMEKFENGPVYLNVYLVWRSLVNKEDSEAKYGLIPIKIITGSEYPQQEPLNIQTANLKNLLLVTSNCRSNVSFDFRNNSMCSIVVKIELKNISDNLEFELILITKNPRYFTQLKIIFYFERIF